MNNDDRTPLSDDLLLNLGFNPNPANTFRNNNLPYFVKQAVCLLYNEPRLPGHTSSYLIGHAFKDSETGHYYVSTFRWIDSEEQLRQIYKAVVGTSLL